MVVWGISWSAGKIIAPYSSKEVTIFWRFFVTFLSLIPLMFLLKIELKKSKLIFLFGISGAILIILYNYFFFQGLAQGKAGLGGVLVTSLNPILNFIFVAIVYRQSIRFKESIGLLLGLLGGAVILQLWKFDLGDLFQSGNLYFLGASFVWVLVTINSQHASKVSHTILYSFYIYGFASLFSLLIVGINGTAGSLFITDPAFWTSIFYISVISTTFGTTMYFIATSKLGSNKASSYIFLVPVSAILGSYLILGEIPMWTTIAGGGLAISAVYLINK